MLLKKLLLTRNSEEIYEIRNLIEKQTHKTLVLWAIDCGEVALSLFENRISNDLRPRLALEAAKQWAKGEIKMPIAKKAAYDTHISASELQKTDPSACAAARALGHVIGTIHVETHALGVLFYTATAIAYQVKIEDRSKSIKETIDVFYNKLLVWEKETNYYKGPLAAFLMRENQPNKEFLLHYRKK